MDELLNRAAAAIGMPPSLAERSAQARAEKEGTTVEAVLREWAGDTEASEDPESTDSGPAEEPDAPEVVEDDAPAADAAPTEITTDYLVQLASEAKKMPPKLVLSSAEARARNANQSVDEVLAQWAGVDVDALAEQVEAGTTQAQSPAKPSDTSDPAAEPAPVSPDNAAEVTAVTAAVVAGAAGSLSVEELLVKVQEVKGMPPALAKRSAEARSAKTGEPVEAVLAEWAGVDVAQVAAATVDEPVPDSPMTELPDAENTDDDNGESDEIVIIEAEVPSSDTEQDDEAVAAGVTSRGGYPSWLAAAFVLIPLLAVAYILVAPNGPDCGTAGQLRVDEASGLAVNCDGSDYGSSTIDFFAQGAALYTQCAACHGSAGEGGAGPAFSGGAVLATFPAGACDEHIEWVSLGSANWPDATYGATDKPVGGIGVMPSYEASLTPEQIAAVALYERVQFGGEDLETAETDCGLVEPDGDVTTEASAP